ncbi:hypothetical protein V8J88_07755 [Massilia sp. W12]|uniref:hypothetical protein n=1 Tax=Massilia sp. W12 TaxID=3126507 RepID=UPI0030D16FAA
MKIFNILFALIVWLFMADCSAEATLSGMFVVVKKDGSNAKISDFRSIKIGVTENKIPVGTDGNYIYIFKKTDPGEKVQLEVVNLPDGWDILDRSALTVTLPLVKNTENPPRHNILLCKSDECSELALVHYKLKPYVDGLLNRCNIELAKQQAYSNAIEKFKNDIDKRRNSNNIDAPVNNRK